jgi:hypothetical protein
MLWGMLISKAAKSMSLVFMILRALTIGGIGQRFKSSQRAFNGVPPQIAFGIMFAFLGKEFEIGYVCIDILTSSGPLANYELAALDSRFAKSIKVKVAEFCWLLALLEWFRLEIPI